jgi:hypothetical protein
VCPHQGHQHLARLQSHQLHAVLQGGAQVDASQTGHLLMDLSH